MIISIGLDDCDRGNGTKWFLDFVRSLKNKDGSPVRCTFFVSTRTHMPFEQNDQLKETIRILLEDGHELACHGSNHVECDTEVDWKKLMWDSIVDISDAGFPIHEVTGFRSPYLVANKDMFAALKFHGFEYDSSTKSRDVWCVDGVYTLPITNTLTDSVAVDYSMMVDEQMTIAQMVGMYVRLKGDLVNVAFHPNMWSDDVVDDVPHDSTVAQRREAIQVVMWHWISQPGVWIVPLNKVVEIIKANRGSDV